MNRTPALHKFCAALLQLPVVLAMVVLGLLPAGVMPAQGADGSMVMAICSGGQAVSMTFDPATGEYAPAKPVSEKSGCDWAMAQVVSDMGVPVALPVPVFTTHRAAPTLAQVLWHPAHDPRGIQARGPPSSA